MKQMMHRRECVSEGVMHSRALTKVHVAPLSILENVLRHHLHHDIILNICFIKMGLSMNYFSLKSELEAAIFSFVSMAIDIAMNLCAIQRRSCAVLQFTIGKHAVLL